MVGRAFESGWLGLTTLGSRRGRTQGTPRDSSSAEPVGEAKKWVGRARAPRNVPTSVIVAMHMGMEADLRTGIPTPGQVPHENAALEIAKQCPEST